MQEPSAIGMQLLMVWVVVFSVMVPHCLALVDLFCDCRVNHHKDWTFALHCTRDKGGSSEISCQKDRVLEIPRDYHWVPGYALVKLNRVFKPWAAAQKACEQEGARLAVPPDRAAVDGLKQIFPKEKGVWYAYVGISDQASEGVFVGVDGRPAPYLPWQPNQPDNYGNEDCVDVRNDGLLNDVPCASLAPFICERRLAVSVPDDYSWSELAGRFYKVHAEKRTHAEASDVCRSEGAALAVTDTWRRGLALLRLFEPSYDSYFLGFTDEAVEGDFVTETGRRLKDMEFLVWAPNEPDNNGQGRPENCLALNARGVYNDVRCDEGRSFICEIVPL